MLLGIGAIVFILVRRRRDDGEEPEEFDDQGARRGPAPVPAGHGTYRGGADPTNIGNPHEFTVRQLAERVLALTGSKSKIVERPLPVDDPRVRQPDITRARKTLGWEPKVSLEEGLRRTIAYFQAIVAHEGARKT